MHYYSHKYETFFYIFSSVVAVVRRTHEKKRQSLLGEGKLHSNNNCKQGTIEKCMKQKEKRKHISWMAQGRFYLFFSLLIRI